MNPSSIRELETCILAALLERRFGLLVSGDPESGRVAWAWLHEVMGAEPDENDSYEDPEEPSELPDEETWNEFVYRGEALLRESGIPKSLLGFPANPKLREGS
jgi:hypothetical protein